MVMTGLLVAHVSMAALWLGAMAYSLFLVQPRLARMLGNDPARLEDAQRELAAGNRWPVVGMIVVLWLTGAAMVAQAAADQPIGWWVGVGAKALLLATASAVFWWVSWRAWPRRVFALAAELAGLQRQFRVAAVAMFVLVAAAFVLGVATAA